MSVRVFAGYMLVHLPEERKQIIKLVAKLEGLLLPPSSEKRAEGLALLEFVAHHS